MKTRSKAEGGRGSEAGRIGGSHRTTEDRRSGGSGSQTGLRRALLANAAFSGASGVAIAATSAILPDVLGAGTSTFYVVIGILLIAFALRLVLLARGERIPRREGLLVVAGDWGWVVGSAVVIGMGLLTTLGVVLVGATAVVVGGFAVWQGRNLPRGGN